MDVARHQLLADAGLAGDQNGRTRRSALLCLPQHFRKRRAANQGLLRNVIAFSIQDGLTNN
jgi:hypothetical protein